MPEDDTLSLHDLLDRYRAGSRSEREKGMYLERLVKAYLTHDPVQKAQYDGVWAYAEWAARRGQDGRDTGIDLVAGLRGEPGRFCAIQCKFYAAGKTIRKGDIDSFFTASGKTEFARRLFVDTTRPEWSENARKALEGQTIECVRIGLADLEQSPIDWRRFVDDGEVRLEKKTLRPHQKTAVAAVEAGLAAADRGKLIMACGTGKTYTSLKVAERIAGAGGRVLYLVPSLALMQQTVREWAADAGLGLTLFAVCSDAQVGARRAKKSGRGRPGGGDDSADLDSHDLALPPTTDAARLAAKLTANPGGPEAMTVVFSTYQSIQVIADAQARHGLGDFDLIVCDEAHRTTGATLAGEADSNFVKVHDQSHIRGKKRLYMTATPRIFSDAAKTRADEADAWLASMDDPGQYGETLHTVNFSEAVERQLLCDYKVLVLAVDEAIVSAGAQRRLTDASSELVLDDAAKIIGCYRALAKDGIGEDPAADTGPMRRAVAFYRDIKSSKLVRDEFTRVVDEYLDRQGHPPAGARFRCEVEHVDGAFGAKARTALLDWLSDDSGAPDGGAQTCRILGNARCLSEGVDVPTLDAILFMHPRKSQIDVVQSVGRVMRRAPGKKMGYVILPVGVPSDMPPDEALNNNEKYRVIWQILNALRSHDDRLDATINRAGLGEDVSSRIEIVTVSDALPGGAPPPEQADIGGGDGGGVPGLSDSPQQAFVFDEFHTAIMAKIVKTCGTRDYWEDWAGDIAKIAQTHITRIRGALDNAGGPERRAFDAFLAEIRDDLNDAITETEAIEMLAQHIITRPVFDALFRDNRFTLENPVSKAMQAVLRVLEGQRLEREQAALEKFYASVRRRIEGIDSGEARQKLVVELYDRFFRGAFPRMTERLGIVYTPVEVVDFILHSVNDLLKDQFGKTLGSAGVHILDPFAGTGTFITRLLQSGLVGPDDLARKYGGAAHEGEIHANEIVLLAYYIAAVNIESAWQDLARDETYRPFPGMVLTDTFQLYEKDDMISRLLADNSARRVRQKQRDITVIIGNPPYSAGQKSANDAAANVAYPGLDARIAETYAAASKASSRKDLYDSYIRAFRWASDRIGDEGVIGFVSGGGWLDRGFADGMRKHLRDDFAAIYVVNLRGDIRKNMFSRGRAGEGENIFGQASMTPVTITFLIRTETGGPAAIRYLDVGDNQTRGRKLALLRDRKSITGLAAAGNGGRGGGAAGGFRVIEPDEHHDWLGQRDPRFDRHIAIGDKKAKKGDTAPVIFENYSLGINTNRDAWSYNFSEAALTANIRRLVGAYAGELERGKTYAEATRDPKAIKWSSSLERHFKRGAHLTFDRRHVVASLYRPFTRQMLYGDPLLVHRVGQMPKIFPHAGAENRVIIVTGVGSRSGFSCLMADCVPCLDTIEKGQCFPLKLYEPRAAPEGGGAGLFAAGASASGAGREPGHAASDAITDAALRHFRDAAGGAAIGKEDLFYYIYGLLHAGDYRARFADNLAKQLPRIPAAASAARFRAFSEAGRALADLHVNYDDADMWPVTIRQGDLALASIGDPQAFYRVTRMKKDKPGPGGGPPASIIYNANIAIDGIPPEAWDYVISGKPALDWVIERQCVKTDKKSGIVNDANHWANDRMNNPAYPLDLLRRVITVSVETMKIVRSLPEAGE